MAESSGSNWAAVQRWTSQLVAALGFLVLLCTAPDLQADGFVHAQGTQLVDGQGHVLMLRGTNLGNWLVQEGYMFRFEDGPQSPREIEALTNELLGPADSATFWHAYREHYITRKDIQFIRDAGFNSIRIPFHYKYFTADNPEGFALVDQVIAWAREAGLYVILDMHCAPGGQTGSNIDDSWGYPWLYSSPAEQQQAIDIWKRIAAHYHDDKTVLGYDLLNEPIASYPGLEVYNSQLEPVYRRTVAAIREVDTNHVVILGGAQWDTNFTVFGPPFDTNTMYNFHKYWMPPVQAAVQPYLDFREKYNVPLWMSESGENTDEWCSQFVQVLEQNKISWAFWPYKKMEVHSSPVTFNRPVYWDEIVAFAKLPRGSGVSEERDKKRPPADHIKAAFADLLEKVELQNCVINGSYLKALGLSAPQPTQTR